jgi:hypothetical protein
MNGEVFEVSFERFGQMVEVAEGREIVMFMAKLASEILVGMFDDKPLCYIGLIPRTLISSEVYVWLLVTDEGKQHPFILARYARGIVETVMLKYTLLYGHCFNEKSARWLRSLGAEFVSETEFEFRRD